MLPTNLKHLILVYINDNNYNLIVKLVDYYNGCTLTQSYNPNSKPLDCNSLTLNNNIHFKFVITTFTECSGSRELSFNYYRLVFIKPTILTNIITRNCTSYLSNTLGVK